MILWSVVLGLVVALFATRYLRRTAESADLKQWIVNAVHAVPLQEACDRKGQACAYADVRSRLRRAREAGEDPDTVLRRLEVYTSSMEAHNAEAADALVRTAMSTVTERICSNGS